MRFTYYFLTHSIFLGNIEKEALYAHNVARRKHENTNDLVWDAELARYAQAYANVLANTGKFEHSNELGALRQNENLYYGIANGAKKFADAAFAW